MMEIVEARESFDYPSSQAFPTEVYQKAQAAIGHPRMHPFVSYGDGIERRRFTHKGCVIVYEIRPTVILVVRVFGPGQDWQGRV